MGEGDKDLENVPHRMRNQTNRTLAKPQPCLNLLKAINNDAIVGVCFFLHGFILHIF